MLMRPDRRVQAHRQPGAADRQELRVHRRRQRARSRRRVQRRLHRQPARSTTVASQPHPERKTVLIDANALLLTDIPVGERFTSRHPHARATRSTRKNSSFEAHSQHRRAVVVRRLRALLESARDAAAGAHANGRRRTRSRRSRRCRTRAACSSATLQLRQAARADAGAARRSAHRPLRDARSGTSRPTRKLHGQDALRQPLAPREEGSRRRALSEPKEPIVFWLDRNIPERYRAAVRDGILEWNKAFEKIGFKDAIVVKQQADDADFDTSDARHAIGALVSSPPTRGSRSARRHVDPRTGEILDADIGDPGGLVAHQPRRSSSSRCRRRMAGIRRATARAGLDGSFCTTPARRSPRSQFGLDLLDARGEIEPGQPRGGGVRHRLAQGGRDARGRPHARPAPQLPRVDGLPAGAALRPRVHRAERHLAAR